jgi:hypothetical protein
VQSSVDQVESEPVVEPVFESVAEVVTEPVAEPVADEPVPLGSVWPEDTVLHLAETNTMLTEPRAESTASVGKKASPKAERKYATGLSANCSHDNFSAQNGGGGAIAQQIARSFMVPCRRRWSGRNAI